MSKKLFKVSAPAQFEVYADDDAEAFQLFVSATMNLPYGMTIDDSRADIEEDQDNQQEPFYHDK